MEPKGKEPYEKPEVVVIALEAEQVLAVGCKTNGPQLNVGIPPGSPGFPQCGIPQGCVTNGS